MLNNERGWAIFATRYKRPEIVRMALDGLRPYVRGISVWVNDLQYPGVLDLLNEHDLVKNILETKEPAPGKHALRLNRLVELANEVWGHKPKYLVSSDDDEALPEAKDFPDYLESWCESEQSVAIKFRLMRFHNDFCSIRIDNRCTKIWHPKITKTRFDLEFTSACWTDAAYRNKDNGEVVWPSPWPLRHFRTCTDEERKHYRAIKNQADAPDAELGENARRIAGAVLYPYDPEMTTGEYETFIRRVEQGNKPDGSWSSNQ